MCLGLINTTQYKLINNSVMVLHPQCMDSLYVVVVQCQKYGFGACINYSICVVVLVGDFV